jgi:type I restriction enzyme S subunit
MREDWKEIEISKAGSIITGNTPPKKNIENYNSNDFPFYKPTDLEAGKNVIKSNDYLSKTGFENSRIAPTGSILVTCIGATIGKTGLIKKNGGFNQQINAVIPFNGIDSSFVFYQIKGTEFQNQIIKNASSTTLPILNKNKFSQLKFKLAPLPEQKIIVSKIEQLFSELDNGIANLRSAKEKLDIYRQAVLKKAFEDGFGIIDISKDWSNCKISELCEVVRGGSPRPAGDDRFYNGKIPFLKVADLTRNRGAYLIKYTYSIKDAGLKKTRLVKANTLLLSNSGATLGVPKICTFQTTFNDGIAAFLNLDEETLLFHYYFWCSKTSELRAINQGAAQPNLNTTLIGEAIIPIGPKNEMKTVVKEIESRLSVCDKLSESINESLEKSEALRQSILKKAFSGKFLTEKELEACKKEADWEPAEKLLERIKNK